MKCWLGNVSQIIKVSQSKMYPAIKTFIGHDVDLLCIHSKTTRSKDGSNCCSLYHGEVVKVCIWSKVSKSKTLIFLFLFVFFGNIISKNNQCQLNTCYTIIFSKIQNRYVLVKALLSFSKDIKYQIAWFKGCPFCIMHNTNLSTMYAVRASTDLHRA